MERNALQKRYTQVVALRRDILKETGVNKTVPCSDGCLFFLPFLFFFSSLVFLPVHLSSKESSSSPFGLLSLLPPNKSAKGYRRGSKRSVTRFQRSERSLHLTSRIAFFFFALRQYRSSFFSSDQLPGKSRCFTRRGFSTPYPLRRTAPEIASRHERADHPRSASANATPQ
jgi:hypothetical protein